MLTLRMSDTGKGLERIPHSLKEFSSGTVRSPRPGEVAGQARDGHHQVGEDVTIGAVRDLFVEEIVDGGVPVIFPGVGRRFAGDRAGLGLRIGSLIGNRELCL